MIRTPRPRPKSLSPLGERSPVRRGVVHTGGVTRPLHTHAEGPDRESMAARLPGLLEATHAQWSAFDERRRMRAFGFRPAVEPGVLKREWHGLTVRVSGAGLRAALPGAAELVWTAADQSILLDGDPYRDTEKGLALVESLLDMIGAYERWIEAREGREERIQRGRSAFPDRRPLNALAETRRLQRLIQSPPGRR